MPAETHVERGTPMDRQQVFELIRDRLADILEIDASGISEGQSFADDLEADSLDLAELVMALEDEFDITVEEDELEDIKTVGQALDMVTAKLGSS